MKNVGQMIQTLANVGVVAGIVFLGIEVAQNNEYAATEIRALFLSCGISPGSG